MYNMSHITGIVIRQTLSFQKQRAVNLGNVVFQRRMSGSGTEAGSQSQSVNNELPKNEEFYDIIIAGGGIVGTTLAVALGKKARLKSKKILLLESAKEITVKPPNENPHDKATHSDFSNRVVALSPGSKAILDKLGIWKLVWRSQEVNCLQVWDALSDASINFNYPNFSSPVSYIVENSVLSYAISKELENINTVSVEYNSSLKSCEVPTSSRPLDLVTVQLSNGQTLRTNLLVGADGFNSKVRAAIKSNYVNFNYDRVAVVATLKFIEPTDNNTAWQRFMPTGGPIALLPLSSNYSSLVWSTYPSKAKELLDMTPDQFIDAVNSALWHEFPKSELVSKSFEILNNLKLGARGARVFPPSISEVVDGSRARFPLGFGHSSYYVNRRTALIGDAAHRVHPLAGQGLNLGIGDVDCIQRVIDNAVGIGKDFGALDVLQEYETERQRHNLMVQSGIDILHRLYSFDMSPIVALRSVGLSLVNSSDYLKKIIMAQAAA